MSTPREIPGVRAQDGAGLGPVARSVADDLAAIFPNEPRTQSATELRLGSRRGAARATKAPAVNPTAMIGAIAAAALLGVAAGGLVGQRLTPTATASPQSVPVSMAALPSPGPLPAGPLHVAPRQVAAGAPAAPARTRSVSTRRAAVQRKHSLSAHRASTCRGSRCRSTVMAADARLRRAYDSAIDAGVSHKVLSDYHERWAGLRRQAPRRPAMVAARYDEMAQELNSMAAGRQRVAHAGGSRSGPWRSLRTQFAALWR